jgi:hypothetical protein
MGVLEDAIREHLELKRKHGASEEEVERKELEALGPARRDFEAGAEEPADEAGGAAPEPEAELAEPEPEPAVELEPEPAPEPAELAEPEPEPFAPEPPPQPLPEPETATRIHESPIPDPSLTDLHGPDFAEEEESEQASESKPRRDFDFDD